MFSVLTISKNTADRALLDLHGVDLEAITSPKTSKKTKKKRAAPDLDQSASGDIVDIGKG